MRLFLVYYFVIMGYIFFGLGNPGNEYADTRHNIGAQMLEYFRVTHNFPMWKDDKTKRALISKGEVAGEALMLVFPQTFMNKSGMSAACFVKSKKQAEKTVVIYDDLDLPLGRTKISFSRSSGGHNGLASVIKALKTEDFIRVRVGVSPSTSGGKVRKPKGEQRVLAFLLGNIGKSEKAVLKKVENEVDETLLKIIEYGWMKAASLPRGAL